MNAMPHRSSAVQCTTHAQEEGSVNKVKTPQKQEQPLRTKHVIQTNRQRHANFSWNELGEQSQEPQQSSRATDQCPPPLGWALVVISLLSSPASGLLPAWMSNPASVGLESWSPQYLLILVTRIVLWSAGAKYIEPLAEERDFIAWGKEVMETTHGNTLDRNPAPIFKNRLYLRLIFYLRGRIFVWIECIHTWMQFYVQLPKFRKYLIILYLLAFFYVPSHNSCCLSKKLVWGFLNVLWGKSLQSNIHVTKLLELPDNLWIHAISIKKV